MTDKGHAGVRGSAAEVGRVVDQMIGEGEGGLEAQRTERYKNDNNMD